MPAAAVIRGERALFGFIGRKASVAGLESLLLNTKGSTFGMQGKLLDSRMLGADGTLSGGVESVDIKRNTKSEGIQLEQS